MAIAWLVFRENVDRRIFLGAMAILAGAVLLFRSEGGSTSPPQPNWGSVLIVLTALSPARQARRVRASNGDESDEGCPGRRPLLAALAGETDVRSLQFDYYGPFGFGAMVARLDEPMFDLNKEVTAQLPREREIAISGSAPKWDSSRDIDIEQVLSAAQQRGWRDRA